MQIGYDCMDDVFPAQIAGMFYSANGQTLQNDITNLLNESQTQPLNTLKALIVPHACFSYSGKIAASAYKLLSNLNTRIKRVVVISPCHRYLLEGIAIPERAAFQTPIDMITIDHAALNKIKNLPFVVERNKAFHHEHGVEVQLPFLQAQLGQFELIPLLVGHITANAITAILDILLEADDTLLVISSDLSHFHDDTTAREFDKRTIDFILNYDDKHITTEEACGAVIIRGFLKHDREKKFRARLLACGNSSDSIGDKKSVVGYAAIAFEEREPRENGY